MYVDKVSTERLQVCEQHGRVVDKSAALSCGRHFAADDAEVFVGVVINVVLSKEGFEARGLNVEDALNDAFLTPFLYHTLLGLGSRQK